MKANFDRLARRQHGLVTTTQLGALGWSRTATRRAVEAGRLIPVRAGVLRPAGAAVTREQALMAAVLAAGDGIVVSHASAARLWGWPGFPEPAAIDLLAEGDRRCRLAGVRGHRTAVLPPSHRTALWHIPVTTPERTLVDACGLVPLSVLEESVDDALRRKALRLPRVVRVLEEIPPPGRRPVAPVLAVLRDRIPGYDPGGSRRELDLVNLLVRAGFERPRQQIRVRVEGRTHFVDVGWPALKVGYEYDSVEVHDSVTAFHRDRERLRRLKRSGWDIWPVTSRTSANEILAIAALAFGHWRAG